MSSFFINSLRNGTIFRKSSAFLEKVNPVAKLALTTIYIITTALAPLEKLIYILILTATTTLITARKIELAYIMRVIIVIATLTSVFVGLFYPWEKTLTVFLRINIIGLWTSKFIVTTDPTELSRELEKIGISPRLSLVIPLTMKLIPEIAKDAEETLTSQYYRGEIKGNKLNPRKYATPLTLLLATTITKSKYIAEALASKAALKGRKTYYTKKKTSKKKTIAYIFVHITLLLLIMTYDLRNIF